MTGVLVERGHLDTEIRTEGRWDEEMGRQPHVGPGTPEASRSWGSPGAGSPRSTCELPLLCGLWGFFCEKPLHNLSSWTFSYDL